MARMAGALVAHDALAPLTKNVSRAALSRQNCAKAPTTSVLTPSTVRARELPLSAGRRDSTPLGAGRCAAGSGSAKARGAVAVATAAAIHISRVRRSNAITARR